MIDDNVKYQDVSSSNLLAVGYDEENANLFIVFKDAKTGQPSRKYAYYHVPPNVYAELMAAPSHGKYHAAHIKGRYSYDQLQL
jgi:hypothetical protein